MLITFSFSVFLRKILLRTARLAWHRGSERGISRIYIQPYTIPKSFMLHFSKSIRLLVSFSLFFLALSTGCGPKQSALILDAEDQFVLAKRELEKKDYVQAVTEFQKLIFNYPGAVFIDSAQYLLGVSYFNQKEYPLASTEFDRLLSSFPTSHLSDDASFMVAFCDFKMSSRSELDQEHTLQTIEKLQSFLDDYPTSNRAGDARNLLGECRSKLAKKAYETGCLYLKMKHYESALIYLKEVVNDYHDSPWSASARFQLAEVYFKQKKFDQAKEEYQKFLEDFPQDKWAKKAKERLEKLSSSGVQVKE